MVIVAPAGSSCQFPGNPEGTLDRVEGGTLRVGVIEDPPWVDLSHPEPRGVEPDLVREFAGELGAEIEWVEETDTELFAALRGFQLDLVIGGLTTASPYAVEAAFTRPDADTEVEIGVPPGAEFTDELGGERIWVRRHSSAAALLKQEEEDAIPIVFDHLRQVDAAALLESWEIEALGYESTDYILRDDEHAFAAAAGENTFLVELEDFLLDRRRQADLTERLRRYDWRLEDVVVSPVRSIENAPPELRVG